MANTKTSGLTALAGSALDAADYFPVLDSSATELKKMLASAFALADGGAKTAAFTAAAGYLYRLDLSTPPTDTFTAATSDVVTFATLTPIDGMKVRVASSTTLPAGLAASTTYFTRDCSGSTCKLAATLGGSAIDITSTGTGTHTATFGILPTFPGSPSVGDRFGYVLSRSHTIYDAMPNRNGSSIMGGTDPQPYLLYIQGEAVVWRYDSTSSGLGWMLESDCRIPGKAAMYRSTDQTSLSGLTKITSLASLSDVGGLCDATNNKIMARRSNRYDMAASARFAALSGAMVSTVVIYKNGSAYRYGDYYGNTGDIDHLSCMAAKSVSLIPADYVELYGYANGGTSQKTTTSDPANPTIIELSEIL